MKKIKSIFIIVCLCIITLLGAGFSLEQPVEQKIPAIMYHSIHPKRNNAYVISPSMLEQDLMFIQQQGYTTIFTSQLIDYVDGKQDLPEKPIIITFDDGFYNTYTNVYPLMKKYNMKCNVSIVGSYADNENGKQNEFYSYLTWQEISELSATPYFEFHNHSYDMHSINANRKGVKQCWGESEEEYIQHLKDDAQLCREKLFEATGKVSDCFCYPFGIYTELSHEVLKEIGYRAFMTCREKTNQISAGETSIIVNRFNRPCWLSTYEFFRNIEKS